MYPALKHMCPLGRRGAENGFFRSVFTPKYPSAVTNFLSVFAYKDTKLRACPRKVTENEVF